MRLNRPRKNRAIAGARPFGFKGRSSVFAFASRPCLSPLPFPFSLLPFAVGFRCHPEPIRAKRGWVRDLLLLSCFFFPASSFLLLLSGFFLSPFFARHPDERSVEGSLFAHNSQQPPAVSKRLLGYRGSEPVRQRRFSVRHGFIRVTKCPKINAASAAVPQASLAFLSSGATTRKLALEK